MTYEFKKEGAKIIDFFKSEILPFRGNKANPSLIENLLIDYWNQKIPLKQLGAISAPSFTELVVEVWDKNAVNPIISALQKENYSVNISGRKIFIKLPSLTEERRQELIYKIKKIGEDFRKRLRVLRDEFNKKIDDQFKNKIIAEDEKFKLKKDIQEKTEELNKEIENILSQKIEEIKQ